MAHKYYNMLKIYRRKLVPVIQKMTVQYPILDYDTEDENNEEFDDEPPKLRDKISLKLFSKLKKNSEKKSE